jgi:cystathionine gamma-synthase
MRRRFSTDSIHGHDYYDVETGAFKVPLYLTAIFEHPDSRTGKARQSDRGFDLKYSREENPTVRALEKVVTKLEKGVEALAFSSGMATIATIYLSSLQSGDNLVVSKECYGVTQELAFGLAKFGIRATLAGPETEDIIQKIDKGVRLVLVETITNPLLRVADVSSISKRCKEVGASLVVDNTFATPVIYNPLEEGAWLAVHSTTKYMGGHNDVVGGVLVLKDSVDLKNLWDFRRRLGSIMSPFDSFLILRGISTLEIRFQAQCGTALALAEYLGHHPKVESVYYPGLSDSPYHETAKRLFRDGLFGGVLSFKVKGGQQEALKVLKCVKVVKPSPSLGGVESLLTCPVTSAAKTMSPAIREELGIGDNLLRLAVGLEDVEDLKDDISQALAQI